jgi:membrane protein DedA with SNARE-associated domain
VFDSLLHAVSGSPWTYLLIAAVCAGDAMLPLFPSEAIVIAAGVAAANGRLLVWLVAIVAAVGAFAGDNATYWLGSSGLRRVAGRLIGAGRNQERMDWARDQLRRHGPQIIIVARFIPGGRTATTYIAGTLGMDWRRLFVPADAAAAVAWALYSTALGYFGGAAFEHNLWAPLLIATGTSILVAVAGELLRRKVLDRR